MHGATLAIEQAQQGLGGAPANGRARGADRGQARNHVRRCRQVVEADHGHLLWHLYTQAQCLENRPLGQVVVAEENAIDIAMFGQQLPEQLTTQTDG
ncbi:hypothetical protein D9M71_783610 [compost metagenome]